ncbi:2-methylene-furan-3-one reductase [Phytophthora ramorum]|uniref:2-methylene-furan-3-one reductase n=1 Tax=Phytophthora ramorum TaxID=164328 RepID=UPI0030AE45D2|nr:2-methylene-furan-3-one reductase [Phytophthora ramorum]
MVNVPATFKSLEYATFGNFLEVATMNPDTVQKPLQPGDVCVQIVSAAVNPIDYKLAQYGAAILPGFKISDAVHAMAGMTATGSVAEFLDVDAKLLALKPSKMSFNEAASVPLAGQASYQALRGYWRVRFGLDAEVATTTNARNVALVKSLGADQVVGYTTERWGNVLAEHSVDLIYDCDMESGSWNEDVHKILKPESGVLVTLGQVPDAIKAPIGAVLHQMVGMPSSEYLKQLTTWVEAGELKKVIDSVYSLENISGAFKKLMDGHAKGKIVIEVAEQ